ncbi:MAG: ABC transporter ATP-binding protein [Burkholderiales bacterium]
MADAALVVQLAQTTPIPLAARFTCAPGEVLALVGPSGSGKTTLLRAIAGLYRAGSGVIRCGDEVWQDASTFVAPQARRVSLVFQQYALFPHLSTLANVAAAMGHVAPAERAERARALLERVHLGGLDARLPRQLSGGQQQRVAIARALAREPRVLLLDEPFSAVDQVTRRRLKHELAELRRSLAMPIMLVTHDLEEASALADRMVVLSRGETLQEGTPQAVMTRPRSVHVARLVDFRNLFSATIVAQEPARTLLRWGDYTLETTPRPEWAVGALVAWGIRSAEILLHRRDRPSRGEHENPIEGVIADLVPFGDAASLVLRVAGSDLHFVVPQHVAARNGLAVGAQARVSLLASGIHLMDPELKRPPGSRDAG